MADNQKDTATPDYTMGYDDVLQTLLKRRSAATNAAYLLPHLKPGMRVLDFGCAPGTISMGLAEAISPGELHGVDMEASQVDIARAASVAGGHENAVFHVGDVTKLPFEDNFFDAAHCYALLMHVPDTMAALAELKRVLKPGGIIGVGDFIGDSSFIEPKTILNGIWPMIFRLFEANGGHSQLGKELRGRFSEAGFVDIESAGTFESFGSNADTPGFKNMMFDYVLAPAMADSIVTLGIATQEEVNKWREEIVVWESDPSVFAGVAWGEAIGRKPT